MFGLRKVKFITFFFIILSIKLHAQNIVTYAGNTRAERFYSVIELSDGTYVVSGAAKDLDWVTGNPNFVQIAPQTIDNNGVNARDVNVPFLLHISNDLQQILNVVSMPAGAAIDFKHIKLDTPPGATGNIYVSGTTADGYFLARLNNNFVNGIPNAFDWTWNVEALGSHRTRQPWDVGGDGKVVYASGTPDAYDFAAVYRLRADGSARDVVENWRFHAGRDARDGTEVSGMWTPAFSNNQVIPEYSGVVFKADTRCSLRSWTREEYEAVIPDGNGGTKQGQWPMDVFYSSACDIERPQATMSMGGYTGYILGDKDTHRIGAIAVDKTNNHIYIGASINSVTEAGQPDFEPFVIAYTDRGTKKWWSRLYTETPDQSPPDQYVDGLAIDYALGAVVVVGRQHGNNVEAFWAGNDVQNNVLHPPGTPTFHSAFTGTNGDIDVSWLGKLRASNGDLLYSAYVAGYNGGGALGAPYADPELDGWPNHNAGNADLNTANVDINVYVDGGGNVYTLTTARAFVTTANAYQKHQLPANGPSAWAANVRVYTPDLRGLVYSSALTGVNPAAGTGGGNTALHGVFPVLNGVIITGYHFASNNGQAIGTTIPTANIPPWGVNPPSGESAILARLSYSNVEAIFNMTPPLGNCVGQTTVVRDSSYTIGGEINSWLWNFGEDANPATATTQGPHEVVWNTAGEKTVSLIVGNTLGDTDTSEVTYQVFPAPSAEITSNPTNGNLDPAPITVSLSPTENVNVDYQYLWEIDDPVEGTVTYTDAEPNHEFLTSGDYQVRLTVTNGTCTVTDSVLLNVTGGPGPIDPEFTLSQEGVCLSQPVTFEQVSDTNVVSWDWAFGEGASPATANTAGPHEVIYSTPGLKTARLTVSNGVIEQTYLFEFEVSLSPNPQFNVNGDLNNIPTPIQFTPAEGPGNTFEWNFGNPFDSAGTVSTERAPTYVYENGGNYMVSLTVTNPAGCSVSAFDSLSIEGGIDTVFADFTIVPSTQTCVNNTITLTDMSRGYESNERLWYFDDPDVVIEGDTAQSGSPWSSPGPVNVYWTTPGTKRVTLQVVGNNGPDDTKYASQVFEVFPYPNANFDVETDTCNSLEALFTANQTNGNYYEWDFGDGSPSVNASVIQHTYPAPGQYTVTLTVVNNGCRSVATRIVNIGDCEEPLYTAGVISRAARADCASQRYYFEDASQGTFTSWEWDFGAGALPATASGPGPHEVLIDPSVPRPVTITLTVTDESGNTQVITTEIDQ